jgi:guanidinobutyrase
MATGAAPFDSLQVADVGDVPINAFNLQASIEIIERAYDEILSHDCVPLTSGGDHTIVLPILRAMARKHGRVGLVHVDAHGDVNDQMFGEPIAHGTDIKGIDLVEVAPAYDTSGNTALVGVNLLFEMLCVLPGVEYR